MFRVTILASAVALVRAGLFEQCDTLFEVFKSKYHRSYSSEEEAKRSKVFCANMKLADQCVIDLSSADQRFAHFETPMCQLYFI